MNLVIGNTSQLANYFPDSYDKISSRNINLEDHKGPYDRVFITFAEQRTFIENGQEQFDKINVDYTLKIINHFAPISNYIVVYGTTELWNNIDGPIDISMPFNYNETPYINSKRKMIEAIKDIGYQNVIVLHPSNFNSPYRKSGFLFSKIFDSLIHNNKIEIGNVDFDRDLIHPNVIIEESINSDQSKIIGSGSLTHVLGFIKDLYKNMDMNFDDYVSINAGNSLKTIRKNYYSNKIFSNYEFLLKNTIDDIKKIKYKSS